MYQAISLAESFRGTYNILDNITCLRHNELRQKRITPLDVTFKIMLNLKSFSGGNIVSLSTLELNYKE